MASSVFQSRFGKDPSEFSSVEEVNKFVEAKIGRTLKVQRKHSSIWSNRGSVFRINKKTADERIEEALSK